MVVVASNNILRYTMNNSLIPSKKEHDGKLRINYVKLKPSSLY